jgi:hypothetical protein
MFEDVFQDMPANLVRQREEFRALREAQGPAPHAAPSAAKEG